MIYEVFLFKALKNYLFAKFIYACMHHFLVVSWETSVCECLNSHTQAWQRIYYFSALKSGASSSVICFVKLISQSLCIDILLRTYLISSLQIVLSRQLKNFRLFSRIFMLCSIDINRHFHFTFSLYMQIVCGNNIVL